MSQPTIDEWIRDCAAYLIELRTFEEVEVRPARVDLEKHSNGKNVFHDFSAIGEELNRANDEIKKAYKRLHNLRSHFSKGELKPFESIEARISRAATTAAKACAEIGAARDQLEFDHPPQTRALALQQSAVRMAYAYLHMSSPRSVRAAAKKMLTLAGIAEPSERALTMWINEEKAKDKPPD